MENRRFNIRVYGICLDPEKGILLTDERIKGLQITKFPGGGLEFGEGTIECLQREFIEETGQAVRILNHFYTTDWFVRSAFHSESQILSIYYEVAFEEPPAFGMTTHKFDFPTGTTDCQVFRWMRLEELSPESFNFPIDKKVAEMIIARKPII
jgi:8-oxo-dGTP diphosphatase